MTPNRIRTRWLAWFTASLIVAAMAIAISTEDAPAQTKTKTDPKAKAKAKTDDTTDQKSPGEKSPGETKSKKPIPTTLPARVDTPDSAVADHVALIDEYIRKGWKSNSVYPSERCTDHEFIRRVSLDIIGRIPTVKEIDVFMKHPEKSRRYWLINAMLDGKEYEYGKEYAQNFANMWTVNLMTRSGSGKHYQYQMNDWLYTKLKGEGEGTSATPGDWSKIAWLLIAATGDTNKDDGRAVNYLLHNLGEEIKQDVKKLGKWDMVPATSRTTKLFLGTRIQCVQCHDHPFKGEWDQVHFWGINAFFRQVDTNGKPGMMAGKKKKGVTGAQEFTLKDRTDYNSTDQPHGLIPYERRNTVVFFTDPRFLYGQKIPKDYKGTRREKLAELITTSPWFGKAFVNRTWSHFFGKSFSRENPDDFGEHNPISHPELLDKLSEDWAKQFNHNPKVLIRWICNSQAYGLSSRANEWNDKTEDETLFARMLLKPMTPEQMFESIVIATNAKFSDDERDRWFARLVSNFGNDEGEEGSYTGTVIQALLLMNGKEINKAITETDGSVAAIAKKHGGASQAKLPLVIHDMYMRVLNRPPTKAESIRLTSPDTYNFVRTKTKAPPNTPAFWQNYYQDIMWALINSNEFILNH